MAEELVTVASTDLQYEAELIQGYLESAGIESYLLDNNTLHINWFLSHALHGTKIQVRREDYEEAVRILEEMEDAHPMPEAGVETRPCPACTSRETAYRSQRRRWFVASYLGMSFAVLALTLAAERSGFRIVREYFYAIFVFVGVAFALGVLIIPFIRIRMWQCLNCGHVWKDGSDTAILSEED